MKIASKITLLIVLSLLLGCKGKDQGAGKTNYLSQDEFIKKVFNYKQNTEWKFLGDKPAVIDFYADWCKPCKMVAPIMEELSGKYAGKVIFYKVNIDNEKDLANTFQITSIPTVLFIPLNGQPQVAVGVQAKEDYTKTIEALLIPSITK